MTNKMINYQQLGNNDISASISNLNVHDHLKGLSIEALRELCDGDRQDFGIAVLNITGELNVGTIVRNAHLTGAKKVGILGRRKYDKRGTVGSEQYFDVERVDALNDDGLTIDTSLFWNWMDKNNFWPIFCEHGGTPLSQVDWGIWITEKEPRLPCLVFGNENRGIQDDILNDLRGEIVSIEQKGVIRSFNVASASAIIMYEMAKGLNWL